jgi:UPF0755 protein
MANRLARAAAVVFFLALAVLVAAGAYLYTLNLPAPRIPRDGKSFKVLKGESAASIAARLHEEGLIRSARFLRLVSRVAGTEGAFKSGYFHILPNDTSLDIHNLLVSGYQEQVKVTIPEGWTLKKIAEHLEAKGIAPAREVLEAASSPVLLEQFGIPASPKQGGSLEGYLFPDTYFFPKGYPAYGVVEAMVGHFFEELREIAPEAGQWAPRRIHERVIMASIVEREYRRAEEAPLIASVFFNRMRYNIGLESCATLEYIITDIQDRPHPSFLTQEDKTINSPYNTYKWAGLPPGPISNPGRVALDAAFHPAATQYFYFVLRDPATGQHYFSESLKEHNWAKYIYLKQIGTGG